MVGALDLFAQGKWVEKDGAVVLTSIPGGDAPRPGFETLTLRQEGDRLIPPDDWGRGAHVRPERAKKDD